MGFLHLLVLIQSPKGGVGHEPRHIRVEIHRALQPHRARQVDVGSRREGISLAQLKSSSQERPTRHRDVDMRGLGVHVHPRQPPDPVQRCAEVHQCGGDDPAPVVERQADPCRRVEGDVKAAAAAAELVETLRDLLLRHIGHRAPDEDRAALQRVAHRNRCVVVLLNEGAHRHSSPE